jgi:hypothetical protein
LSGSSFRSSLRSPANIPPKNAIGSLRASERMGSWGRLKQDDFEIRVLRVGRNQSSLLLTPAENWWWWSWETTTPEDGGQVQIKTKPISSSSSSSARLRNYLYLKRLNQDHSDFSIFILLFLI